MSGTEKEQKEGRKRRGGGEGYEAHEDPAAKYSRATEEEEYRHARMLNENLTETLM
ncbi:hypothetical protein SARC_15701, partial [Sphaeroforma arctica JP610]